MTDTAPCGCRPDEGVYCEEAERLRRVWLHSTRDYLEQWYSAPEWGDYKAHIRKAREEDERA